ncbi:unnamed protein product, partial [Polarella glacialis]
DRTDALFSAFQAMEPESNGTVRREIMEKALVRCTGKWLTKNQLSEALRTLGVEPVPVQFSNFLRVLKNMETFVEGDFEECLDDILAWEVHSRQAIEEEEGTYDVIPPVNLTSSSSKNRLSLDRAGTGSGSPRSPGLSPSPGRSPSSRASLNP